MFGHNDARVFPACVNPAVVQADKVADVERDQAAIFFRGEIQLGFIGQAKPLFFQRVNGIVTALAKGGGQSRVDIFVKEEPQFHPSSSGQLANLSAPMIRVGIAFQVAVNFLLVVEIVGQRRVQLRLREMRQALQNLIRCHAKLVITGNRAHRDARAFDDGRAIQDSRIGRNVRIFDSVCFHRIKLTTFRRASKPAHPDDELGVRLRIADCGLASAAIIELSVITFLCANKVASIRKRPLRVINRPRGLVQFDHSCGDFLVVKLPLNVKKMDDAFVQRGLRSACGDASLNVIRHA